MAKVNVLINYVSQGAGKAKSDLDQVDKRLGNVATTAAKAFGGGAGTLAVGGSVVAGLAALSFSAAKAADEAAKTERAFVNLSGGSAKAQANMEALNKATRGYISTAEQQKIANQLLGMQLVNNAEEMEVIVQGARRLGKEFRGLGTKEAAEEFAIMMSNMSFLRLDSFGLSSQRVKDRVEELMKATKGLNKQQAFNQAVMEEMEATQERLGEEYTTIQDELDGVTASWKDLWVTIGSVQDVSEPAKDALSDISGALRDLDNFMQDVSPRIQAFQETFNESLFNLDFGDFFDRMDELEDQKRKELEVTREVNAATEDETDAREDNSKAMDEQREAIADLLEVEEEYQAESARAWSDFYEDQSTELDSHNKRILKLINDTSKEQLRIENRLAQDIQKINRRRDRSVESIQKDADKRVRRLQEDAKRRDQRKKTDSLQDERLFQLELQHMAEDGNAIGIKRALERREVEKQIASEKSAEEASQEQSDLQLRIDRIREDAQERITEERRAAEEAKKERSAQAEERKAQLTQQLKEERELEEEALRERLKDLEKYRDEQVEAAQIARDESVKALGDQLTESKEMTEETLEQVKEAAARIGPEIGAALAEGISEAFILDDKIDRLLRFTETSGYDVNSFNRRVSTGGASPLRFAEGGNPPSGVPSLVGERGPELIVPTQNLTVLPNGTFNVSSGIDKEVVAGMLEGHLQAFANQLAESLQT